MSVPSALSPFADLFQQNILIRAFEDSLLPNYLYDSVVPEADQWPAHAGLSATITNDGYFQVTAASTPTTVDPTPQSRRAEQYDVSIASYQNTADVDATQAQNMLSDYAIQTYARIGEQAARTLDAAARAAYTSAACAGWTVADGAQAAVTNLKVKRLNGFTTALPSTGPSLRHALVSGGNPLSVKILTTTGVQTRNVIGFIADNVIAVDQGNGVPDVNGPGTLVLDVAVTVADRAAVCASNASSVYRVGEGINRGTATTLGSIDNVTGPLSYAAIRDVRKEFSKFGVRGQTQYGGRYLCHLSPSAYAQLQGDPDYQRLSVGQSIDSLAYVRGVVGVISNMLFIENNYAPTVETVNWFDPAGNVTPTTYGSEAKYGLPNVSTDPLGIELCQSNDAGKPIDTTVFMGDDCAKRYYQPHPIFGNVANLQEIGVAGSIGEPYRVVNDGVAIDSNYVTMIMIAARNRLADKFPVTWQSKQSWTPKSDQISVLGKGIRYKRFVAIQSLAS